MAGGCKNFAEHNREEIRFLRDKIARHRLKMERNAGRRVPLADAKTDYIRHNLQGDAAGFRADFCLRCRYREKCKCL